MMNMEDTVQKYRNMVTKIDELRTLLQSKLIKLGAINTDGSMDIDNVNIQHPSFSTLLTKATPEDIHSIINYNLPNKPIDTTQHFNTVNDITDYLYTNRQKTTTKIEAQTLSLSAINLLLLQKFFFYHKFLSYELENMGIPKTDIDNAKTLKNLILLLDRIDRMRETKIIYNDTNNIIYINEDNVIPIQVFDKYDDIRVQTGTINIYENGVKLNIHPFDVMDDIIINPTTLGNHTYTIEYIPIDLDTNRYYPCTDTITLSVEYPSLDGIIILHNITETSRFYNPNSIDDFEGYMEDNWDIDITIYNSRGDPINQPIPFDVYLEDDVFLFTDTTDSLGKAILSNVNIPYHTSDFIKSTIKHFQLLPTPIYFTDEEILRGLTFIKNLEVNGKEITYEVVELYEDDYLDDINGCIRNLIIDNDSNVYYTTYETDQHIELQNVPNIQHELENMVTEILFDGTNIAYEVLGSQKYEVLDDNLSHALVLKVKTKLNNPIYPDINIPHKINLHHNPLSIDQQDLTWYITDPNAPTGANIRIRNEDTGKAIRRLPAPYILSINNNDITLTEPVYFLDYDTLTLNYGQNDLIITLKDRNNSYISSIHNIITILSNFIIPEETEFFLNTTPEIYYKPLGKTTKNKQVLINYPTNSKKYYTNNQGLISQVQTWLNPQQYNLTITANSDELTEEINYSYILQKPFTVTQTQYSRTSIAKYQITNLNTQYPCTYIVSNQENNNIVLSGQINAGVQTAQTITINRNANNIGTNTLIVNNNGYEEQYTFLFYDHIFELLTSEIYVGTDQTIQIKCLDPSITTMTISGTGITQTSITKSGQIFTIICKATQASNALTLSMNGGEVTETSTLIILKNNIQTNLVIEENMFVNGTNTHNKILLTSDLPTTDTITLIFTDNNISRTIQYSSNNDPLILKDFYQIDRTPGIYQATITFNGNNNYNSFTQSISYTILSDDIYIADVNINNNDLKITEIERNKINNTNVLTNADINDNKLFLLFNNVTKDVDEIDTIKSIIINTDGDLIVSDMYGLYYSEVRSFSETTSSALGYAINNAKVALNDGEFNLTRNITADTSSRFYLDIPQTNQSNLLISDFQNKKVIVRINVTEYNNAEMRMVLYYHNGTSWIQNVSTRCLNIGEYEQSFYVPYYATQVRVSFSIIGDLGDNIKFNNFRIFTESEPYEHYLLYDMLTVDDTSVNYYINGGGGTTKEFVKNKGLKLTIGSSGKYIQYGDSWGITDTNELAKYYNKTVRFQAYVEPSGQCSLIVYQLIDGSYVGTRSQWTQNTGEIYVDTTINPTATRLIFRIDASNNEEGTTVYSKEWKVYEIT